MEDKTFELIEKLYSRMEEGFSELRSEMNDGFTKVNVRIDRVEQNSVRMEQKIDDKIGILFDAVQGNTEAINSLRTEMQALETKVDAHEVKLKIVK